MFSDQSLLAGNGASVTCLRESREPITKSNVATYVTPLVVRNFWLNIRQNFAFPSFAKSQLHRFSFSLWVGES